MVVVAAVAFVVGAVCLYHGARALRTKRAIRRLNAEEDGLGDPTDWLDPPETRPAVDADLAADPQEDVSVERGFVLLALGLLCLLFGFLTL